LATDVRVVGVTPGRSATVEIGRGTTVRIGVGETVEDVKLLRADQDGAVLSIHGKTQTLPLVAAEPSVGNPTLSDSITLRAGMQGQFYTNASVNGRSMGFLIDTGASLTTLTRTQAQRIGLRYRNGARAKAGTVNGVVNGWRVSLDSIRIGDVMVRDVDAIIVDNDALPMGLLGMSYLDRFDMQRQGSTLVLRRRR